MSKTEFSIYLYLHINNAIEDLLKDYDEKKDYSGFYLSIEKSEEEGLLVPYEVSIVTIDHADYLFMPKVTALIEDYVDCETGKIVPTSCVKSIADFIDRWMERNDIESVLKGL